MKKLNYLILGLFLSLFVTEKLPANSAGQSLPNIIFFLADDIGWADPGRYHEYYSGKVIRGKSKIAGGRG